MLKKLLPELKKSIQSLIKSRPNQQEQNPPNNQDVNLLVPITIRDEKKKVSPKLITTTNFIVLVTFLVFLIFFITNLFFDLKLKEQKDTRDNLLLFVESKKNVEKNVSNISRLINIYKTKKSLIRPTAQELFDISPVINKYSQLQSLQYNSEQKNYKVVLNSEKVINYAFMIYDLLKIKSIDSIILSAVDYNSSKNTYDANLEIVMR